jgi:L-fuculose-phosphate aldolase
MNRKSTLKRDLLEACAHLNQLGYLVADNGLLSVRADQEVLFTPDGIHRARLEARDLGVVRLDGKGKQQVSPGTDMWTQLLIYRERSDVGAVIFAQPPRATGFAVAGEGLEQRILPELVLRLGAVPLIRHQSPIEQTSTEATSVLEHLDRSQAFLIANRGVITVGRDVWEAVARQELVEHYARVLFTARTLGKVETIPDAQVARLIEVHFEREGGRNL